VGVDGAGDEKPLLILHETSEENSGLGFQVLILKGLRSNLRL
jgi:hypothetical protein